MKQVIYLDVLICINLLINYFILLAMSKFLHLRSKRIRLIIASLLGAIYSIIILFPKMLFISSAIIKILMSISIVGAAFGFNFKKIIRNSFIFYIINFIFGGFIFCLWYFCNATGAVMKNGMLYLNISPIFLAFSTILAYIIIRITERLIIL